MTAPPELREGRLAENIVHFARALRKAGVKVGTSQVETAISAVAAAGFTKKRDFFHILRSTLITRADHLEVFDQVFFMFWREPAFLESLIHMLSPQMRDDKPPPPKGAANRRAADALGDLPKRQEEKPPQEQLIENAALSWSDREVLKTRDFEQMTAAELAEAEAALRRMTLPVPPLRTRRLQPSRHSGRADARRTMRQAMRKGGEIGGVALRAPITRPPDLVVLCDISGSMATYARMMMRFLHAIAHAPHRQWGQVHAFTMGTRLTNVTRALRQREPDAALDAIGHLATDWEGGTQIGPALFEFNRRWARRILGRGAVVLLITDGLERGDLSLLEAEATRLARSCRSLVWLNPLLRFDGFAPRAGGVRTLLPIVSSFHACHSLDSLSSLSEALGRPETRDRLLADLPNG